MTLPVTIPRVQGNGDGSTVSFTISFIFWDADDLDVVHTDSSGTETVWTRGTQFTVSGGSGSTGTLTVKTSPTDYTPASGETLTIKDGLPDSQPTAIATGGSLDTAALEQQLDKIVRQVQQLSETIGRCPKYPVSDSSSLSSELPNSSDRASARFGFDSSGEPIVVTADITGVAATAFGTALVEAANAAAAVALLDIPDSIGRNKVINGDMRVAQRGTSFAGLTGSQYTLDRWKWIDSGTTSAVVTITQDTNVPTVAEAGIKFMNSLKIDVTTAETLGTDEFVVLQHIIEAQDATFFGHGATGALDAKLSFWFKSTKTGIFCVRVMRVDASEQYVVEFTISTTDTWEKHTVTIPGDTSGGAIADDNGVGLQLQFIMAIGTDNDAATADVWQATSIGSSTANQVNLLDNSANNVLITGVQYEVGTVATDFEQRTFGQELALCQRYYVRWDASGTVVGSGHNTVTTEAEIVVPLPVSMRAAPTGAVFSTNALDINSAAGTDTSTGVAFGTASPEFLFPIVTVASGLGLGDGAICVMKASEWLEADAEL